MTASHVACRIANRAWIALCKRQLRRFSRNMKEMESVQEAYLLRLMRHNANTVYGQRYGFGGIASIEDFQRGVPITSYEDYQHYVDRIGQGDSGVLTHERVRLFEPSSGTELSSKLIPYTDSLKAEFHCAIAPWMAALYGRIPALLNGPAYWSITPPGNAPARYGRLRVGFDDDSEYLGFIGRALYRSASAVPASVSRASDHASFVAQTLVNLINCRELALVSVWSPTFFTLLLDHILEHPDGILEALRRSGLKGCAARADEVQGLLRFRAEKSACEALWPRLRVISCWTHGPSAAFSGRLREYFPNVEIQGKGLLATEAVVSFPIDPDYDPVLAFDSHFFEFLKPDAGGITLAHQLESGQAYSVLVSTGGGLYRYRMGDLVEVTGFLDGVPTMRFLGKEGHVADLFGEKLNATHVARAIDAACGTLSLNPTFILLAPTEDKTGRTRYALFMACVPSPTTENARHLCQILDQYLHENVNYALCRRLGQLGAPCMFLIEETSRPGDCFLYEMQRRGRKLGDVKPSVLDGHAGWEDIFRGQFLRP